MSFRSSRRIDQTRVEPATSRSPAVSHNARQVGGTGRFCHVPRALKTLIKQGKAGNLRTVRADPIGSLSDRRGVTVPAIGKAATRLDEGQASQLIKEYIGGDAVGTLAVRYGIHRVTVAEHLRRRNIPVRTKGLVPSEADESIILYNQGYSLAAIGKHFGVAANTVRRTLLQSGVQLRGPNELQRGAIPTT